MSVIILETPAPLRLVFESIFKINARFLGARVRLDTEALCKIVARADNVFTTEYADLAATVGEILSILHKPEAPIVVAWAFNYH